MTPKEFRLTAKNAEHWSKVIDKLEARDRGEHRKGPLSEDEKEELDMRKAQLKIWAYQIKHAAPGGMDDPGSMSASAGVETQAEAGAT